MTRFFRRDAKDGDGSAAAESAPGNTNPDSSSDGSTTPPRRSRARKPRARATKTESTTKDDSTTTTTRSRRSGARTRKSTAAKKEATTATKTTPVKKAPPRRTRKAATPPAPPPEEQDEVQQLLGLLRQQAGLIENQNTLLQSLVEAQKQTTRAIERSSGVGADGNGLTEVKPRLAVFVDVPNILYAAERSGVELDWGKVLDFLSRGRTLVRATAYAPISDDPAFRRENERFVVPFMDRGYRIATKPLKRFSGGSVKANFDVELAVDIVTMADRLDVVALVSGDGDFRRVAEMVGNKGVRVEVMAFGNSTARELRETADRYIDIAAYVPELSVG